MDFPLTSTDDGAGLLAALTFARVVGVGLVIEPGIYFDWHPRPLQERAMEVGRI